MAAVIPQGAQVWFAKLPGPIDTTRQAVASFLEFVRSLRFEDGTPKWALPEGWKEAANPEGKGRTATLTINVDGEQLELTLSSLPAPPGPIEPYLLQNINRWRSQLQLGELPSEELAERTIQIELKDQVSAWLVNIEGWAPGSKPRPPEAPGLPFPNTPASHWVAAPLKPFQLAAWSVTDGEQQVAITISSAGGDLIGNIQRWRGQIGLPPGDPDAIQKSLQQIPMGSTTGTYVTLLAPEGAGKPQSILGVIATALERQWFFKLQGDAPLAARERESFEAFVKSVQFP